MGHVQELQTPDGVADIVFYRLRKDWRRFAEIGEIPSRWAYAFHKLPYGVSVDANFVAQMCGVSKRRAAQALREFEQLGLYARGVHGKWTKARRLVPPALELVAVEAKLRDWKRAFAQAVRYLTFADRSWVLLDEAASHAALRNAELFSQRGIGLAWLSQKGQLEVGVPAQLSSRVSEHERWIVNSELVKRIQPSDASTRIR